MTTEKTIRKIYETLNKNIYMNPQDFDGYGVIELLAPVFYPVTYKRNKEKAIEKTMLDFDVCCELGYISVDAAANSFQNLINITEKGAARMETKSDSLRNFGVRVLCALAGAAGTVLCSFLIQLIQSHL